MTTVIDDAFDEQDIPEDTCPVCLAPMIDCECDEDA